MKQKRSPANEAIRAELQRAVRAGELPYTRSGKHLSITKGDFCNWVSQTPERYLWWSQFVHETPDS
jgi:hypothetical protein